MLFSNKNMFIKESHDEMIKAIESVAASEGRPTSPSIQKPSGTSRPQKPTSSPKSSVMPGASISPDSSVTPKATTTPKPTAKPIDRYGAGKPPEEQRRSSIAVFTVVQAPSDGSVVSINIGSVSLSAEQLQTAIKTAFADTDGKGSIYSLSLRYMKRSTSIGIIYAFADISNELTSLQNQAATMLFTGLGGLLAFFLITLFLSNLAMKPTVEAWNQQKQFIADASHELRTPLTVILANASILSSSVEANNSSDQKKWVDSTYTEALRMKQLIDDMLFLARSDAEQSTVEKEEVNFSDLVWSCTLPFESIAVEKGVTIDSDIQSELFIKANELQIKQLITILMDNACKYVNENGSVTVSLKKEQDKAVFAVSNTGSVIPQNDLPHIFERFYRADKVRTYKGGHGLGLSIADRIIKKHKGKITVKSSENSNCTAFTVFLPLANNRTKRKKA